MACRNKFIPWRVQQNYFMLLFPPSTCLCFCWKESRHHYKEFFLMRWMSRKISGCQERSWTMVALMKMVRGWTEWRCMRQGKNSLGNLHCPSIYKKKINQGTKRQKFLLVLYDEIATSLLRVTFGVASKTITICIYMMNTGTLIGAMYLEKWLYIL